MLTQACRLAASLVLATAAPGLAQAQAADTVHRQPFFSWKDAAVLELFVIATATVAPLDTRFAERLQNPRVQENRLMRRTASFVETVTDPGAFVIGLGLYGVGRATKNHRAADLGLHGTEALFIGAQLGNLMKGVVGRARPYVDVTNPHDYRAFRGFGGDGDYRSFPSGHTIAAFAAASAVTLETRQWWPRSVWVIGPAMYVGAAAVGWSRMYDNKHWASDVMTGAAIGTFTGMKVVQLHHRNPRNAIDRILLGASATPLPDGAVLLQVHLSPPGWSRLGLGE
jgi:membrane-associated phospholipid phosphatase